MAVPSYRTLAERTLDTAGKNINAMPSGNVASAEMQARAAHVQAIATIAVAQALLEIGDVLRERLPRGDA
jgi:hypothetical protein